MADRTVTVRLEAAVAGFQAQMARAAATTQAFKGQLSTAGAEGKQSLSTLGTAAANTGQQLAKPRDAMGRFASASKDGVGATDNLTAGLQGTDAALATTAGTMGRTRTSAKKMTKDFLGISPALIGAGGVAYALKETIGAAVEWESAFAGVKKTVTGTPEQLQAIGDGIRDMSKDIPTASSDLAGIAESAGQLGIETDNVLEFTRTIADLGETTNIVGAEGATQLARFANITQMAQSDFDRLGSTIVDLGNNFETTEGEIAEMATRLAGAGSTVGLSEADILGLATAVSSVGIEAQAGGTAFTRVLIDMQEAVDTGSAKLGTFAEVAGMTTEAFAAAWENDAAGALDAFITGLGEVEESGGSVTGVLDDLELSEIRVSDALRRTSGNADGLTDALKTGNDAWEKNTALADEAAQRYETTEAKIQMAKNAVGDLAVSIGDDLLPVIADGVTGLVEFFETEPPDWAGKGQNWGEIFAGGFREGFQNAGLVDEEIPVKVRPEMDFGEDGTWQVVDPFVIQVEPGFGEVGGWTEGLPTPIVTPEVDWSRIEAGTDVLDTVGQAAADAIEPAEEAFQGLEARTPDWSRIEDGTGVMDGLATSFEDSGLAAGGAGDEYEIANEHLENYLDTQRAAVDPMFALNEAFQARVDADRDYADAQQAVLEVEQDLSDARYAATEAVTAVSDAETALQEARESGDKEAITEAERNLEQARRDSADANRSVTGTQEKLTRTEEEAVEASWAVIEAQEELERQAVAGEISFEQFDAKLQGWVDSGKITAEQADETRDRVKLLREENEEYTGNYEASLEADTKQAHREIEAAQARADRYKDGKYEGMFYADITNAEYSIDRLRGMIGNIPTSITTKATVSYSSQGEAVLNVPGRGRLLIGDNQSHDGGWAGEGSPHDGMVKPDEIPTVLQSGEFVVARGAAQRNRTLLEAINDSRMHAGGWVSPSGRRDRPAGPAGGASVEVNVGREVAPSMMSQSSSDNRVTNDNRSVVVQATGDPAADRWTALDALGMHR